VVEVHQHQVQPGDLYLLCSDGLSDRIGDNDIFNIVSDAQGDLKMACTMLINAANQSGGQDNVSVILIRVPENE
jgi:protein phosphatase